MMVSSTSRPFDQTHKNDDKSRIQMISADCKYPRRESKSTICIESTLNNKSNDEYKNNNIDPGQQGCHHQHNFSSSPSTTKRKVKPRSMSDPTLKTVNEFVDDILEFCDNSVDNNKNKKKNDKNKRNVDRKSDKALGRLFQQTAQSRELPEVQKFPSPLSPRKNCRSISEPVKKKDMNDSNHSSSPFKDIDLQNFPRCASKGIATNCTSTRRRRKSLQHLHHGGATDDADTDIASSIDGTKSERQGRKIHRRASHSAVSSAHTTIVGDILNKQHRDKKQSHQQSPSRSSSILPSSELFLQLEFNSPPQASRKGMLRSSLSSPDLMKHDSQFDHIERGLQSPSIEVKMFQRPASRPPHLIQIEDSRGPQKKQIAIVKRSLSQGQLDTSTTNNCENHHVIHTPKPAPQLARKFFSSPSFFSGRKSISTLSSTQSSTLLASVKEMLDEYDSLSDSFSISDDDDDDYDDGEDDDHDDTEGIFF